MLSKGWKLKRIHDLEVLLNDALKFEKAFEQYRSLCQNITGYYIIDRNPLPSGADVDKRRKARVRRRSRSNLYNPRRVDQVSMPKRTDIQSIMLIALGLIIIGQACEFDYSGTQALKALKEEGYRVILINSNPATIMTDPGFADLNLYRADHHRHCREVIANERPLSAPSATVLGQTALNLAIDLSEQGVLNEDDVEMIGAELESIKKAEDRDLFKEAMRRAGMHPPRERV